MVFQASQFSGKESETENEGDDDLVTKLLNENEEESEFWPVSVSDILASSREKRRTKIQFH